MVCPSCLAENVAGAAKCSGCGAPLRRAEAIRRGSVIAGRYELLDPLGKGGMGEVFRARDKVLDESVALKILRADDVTTPESIRRFRAEVKLARRVRHRNVCGIHDYGEDGSLLFIAMELVAGEDLRQRLAARGKLPPDEAYDVAFQVAEGLEAIHEAGVIHRDLKTANIMLDDAGIVRLMDFGIAREWGAKAGFTATGKIVGTPEYMSPEQIRAQPLDFRTDVYALAIVVYELFTGRLPFLAESAVDIIMLQLKRLPPLDVPDLPPSVASVLGRALAKSPEQRQASVAEFATELRRARDGVAPPESEPPTSEIPTAQIATAQIAASETDATPEAHATGPEEATRKVRREAPGDADPEEVTRKLRLTPLPRPDKPPPVSRSGRSLADLSAWRLKVDAEAQAPSEVRTLIEQLASEDASVRWRAAQQLGEHGSAARSAAGALTAALRDPVPFVRSAAAVALKRIR